MKNIISYYYNIDFGDIRQNKDKYYFEYNNQKYFFVPYNKDVKLLQDIYKLHIKLLEKKIPIHQIILNKDGGIVTFINNNAYILLKINVPINSIELNDILFFSQIYMETDEYNLKTLWEEKNDHLEYQIKQIKNRYPLISESFNYFIGLGENAIQILNNVTIYPKVISHKRIKVTDNTFDLYNPLNLVIDCRVRDVCEYFKACFFSGKDINNSLDDFLNLSRLTKNECYLFLARMFYPTYYFDIEEEIIKGNIKEEKIKKITNKVSDYEKILKKIYIFYKSTLKINIEWLEAI